MEQGQHANTIRNQTNINNAQLDERRKGHNITVMTTKVREFEMTPPAFLLSNSAGLDDPLM